MPNKDIQMDGRIINVLDSIEEAFKNQIQKGSRHYLEISIGRQAEKLGYPDLMDKFKNTYAIVPLKTPQKGMKVRIDGRTFGNYAECISGIAVPRYLLGHAGRSYKTFVPNDSMICNFT